MAINKARTVNTPPNAPSSANSPGNKSINEAATNDVSKIPVNEASAKNAPLNTHSNKVINETSTAKAPPNAPSYANSPSNTAINEASTTNAPRNAPSLQTHWTTNPSMKLPPMKLLRNQSKPHSSIYPSSHNKIADGYDDKTRQEK